MKNTESAFIDNDSEYTSFQRLGSEKFKEKYGTKYAYYTGSMYRGIASKDLVIKMGKSGFLGIFGSAGLSLDVIENNLNDIQTHLGKDGLYGVNLIHHFNDPKIELKTVELFLEKGVRNIEASAFMQVTPALVLYRLSGLENGDNSQPIIRNKIIAKISRPETAVSFMSPAPKKMVEQLLEEGKITEYQALISEKVAMCDDICVEADSGGHTDQGVAIVLLPTIRRLRDTMASQFNVIPEIGVGQGGGLGSPEALAAAFIMGADFVCTGSVNQCTVESGMSDTVKDMLQGINIQDTAYAPAGDMFEIGAQVQVLKKGTFFPLRANKLFMLYNHYDSLESIPEQIQNQLQDKYFKKSFADIYEDTCDYFNQIGKPEEIDKAEIDSKHKMALVFRWYFGYSMRIAFEGDEEKRVDYQVHTGPALGAFNQWVKGTELENWRNRHVDQIAKSLLNGAAEILDRRLDTMLNP